LQIASTLNDLKLSLGFKTELSTRSFTVPSPNLEFNSAN
jgi:hypothetical protein